MNRFFTKKQRFALELFSGGFCQLCGTPLPRHWHADHVTPFSFGGKTDVINGQALCPTCNIKKGNKMITLRKWQEDALQQAIDRLTPDNKLFLTHATPGGGKTIHGLSVVDEMIKNGYITHFIVLAPSTTLVTQWASDAIKNYHYELKNSLLFDGQPDFHEYHGMVMTYQGMNENHETLRMFCSRHRTLIIADEIHHVADGQSWGGSFRNAFEESTNILALTGTPWASEGKTIPYIKYDNDGYAIPDFSYTKSTAIKDSVCRVTEFYPTPATSLVFIDEVTGITEEYDTLQEAINEEIPGAYRKTLCSLKHMKALFLKADEQLSTLRKNGSYDAGGLIVAPSIRAAHKFQDDIFALTGEEYTIVHSKTDKPHEKISEFRNSNERWLISVDMVTEGVDIKRLQVCVFLSTKNTELFLRQVIGRIERVRNPESYIDKTGQFYYTQLDVIDEVVDKMIDENKIGKALREQEEEKDKKTRKLTEFEDTIFLEDVRTEHAGLIAEGYHYPEDVVMDAMNRRRNSNIGDIPVSVICKVIMSEPGESESSYEEKLNVPLTEKKKRIRSRINKAVNSKLYRHLNKQATGKEIGLAHAFINKRIGLKKTDDSVSMDLLESKLEFVTTSNAGAWLC